MTTNTHTKLSSERALSSHQAAKLLQVNASSVVKWIKEGRLRAYRTPGGHQRIVAKDLERFAQEENMTVADADANPEQKRMGTTEVAKILQVNPSTVVKWIKAGHLKAETTPGKFNRISAGELARFANQFNMPIKTGLLLGQTVGQTVQATNKSN